MQRSATWIRRADGTHPIANKSSDDDHRRYARAQRLGEDTAYHSGFQIYYRMLQEEVEEKAIVQI